MEFIDFISIYNKAVFAIIDGPHKGKFTKLNAIHYNIDSIESQGGAIFPIKNIKPVLREWKDLDDLESLEVYQIYFNWDKVKEFDGDVPKLVAPKAKDILRIVNGFDYCTGDYNEMKQLIMYGVKINIDVFGAIEKGWAVNRRDVNY